MTDFVTRLAERTMGTAPVVRPVIAPKFAPEPDGHRTDPTQVGEPSLEEPALMTYQRLGQVPPAPDVPERAATTREDDADGTPSGQRTTGGFRPSVEPAPPERASDPGMARPGSIPGVTDRREGDRGLLRTDPPEVDAGFGREDRGYASRLVPEPTRSNHGPGLTRSGEPHSPRPGAVTGRRAQDSPRPAADDRPPDNGSETLDQVEATLARRGVPETAQRPKPEGSPFGASATEVASAREGAAADLSVVVPRTIPEGIERRGERGPRGMRLPEPESPAPAIRVSIGRIEVRAITPPPAPLPRRERTARPAPPSLDDYLKQRGGGRR